MPSSLEVVSRVAQTLVERWGNVRVKYAGSGADCPNCCVHGDDPCGISDDMWPSRLNSSDCDVMNSFYEARQ